MPGEQPFRLHALLSGPPRGRKPGPLTPDGLTRAFAEIRDSTGLKFGPNPPPFHEIRSLASRLYEKERGEEFAQRLLGHKI